MARDDYDDDRPRRGGGSGPLDGFFRGNMGLLILLAICCNGIALILAIIGVATGKDPQAKSNAMVVLIVSAIITAIGVIAQLVMMAAGPQVGGPGGFNP